MNQINQLNPELKNKIYYIEKDQIDLLERKIDKSMTKLKELFNKEELIKFLFKCNDSDKYDFSQGAPGQENPFTEEEISKKKMNFVAK
jgi:hypothetical protein